MPTWNRDSIAQLMEESAAIALSFYDSPEREVKSDGSLVTEADQAIEAHLAGTLDDPENGSYLLGEETESTRSAAYMQAALTETAFVVDPIDGTACYAHHVPIWGVSIGYMEGGVLTEGAIYLPITRELFISEGDTVYLGYVHADLPITWRELTPYTADFRDTGLIAITQSTQKRDMTALPNPLHALACAVLPLAYLLLGRYEAYLAHLKIWDLGGGLPMLLKLGFVPQFIDGRLLDGRITDTYYNLNLRDANCWKLREPCLFARPGVAEQIVPHLRPLSND